MIELVAPEAGRLSGVTERLAKAGEGPSGLALPARNLQATLERLKTAQIDVVYREPHWIVKPGNASGVSIQLTPRVNH